MKVAMVTPYWYPVLGGITTYVAELSRELRSRPAVDVHVIAREGTGPAATVLGGDAQGFARMAVRELERLGPETVHAHGHWYTLAAALRYRNRRKGSRVVFTFHTEVERRGRLRTMALSRLFSRADAVSAVSQDLLDRMARSFRLSDRTAVTHPGVSIRRSTTAATTEFLRLWGLADRQPVVAFVGPLAHPRKVEGLKSLARAMRIVRERFPRATLVVAGDGPLRSEIERVAVAEGHGDTVFLGSVADPAPLFSAAKVYAHISFQEGLPLAVLEAMACATPIVATAIGGIPEVLRDDETGLLTTGQPADIAEKIVELLENPGTSQTLAARAETLAKTELTWSKAASRFLSLYSPPEAK